MKPLRTLSDTDVYQHLTELTKELETLSQQCWSVAGETSLKVCAEQLKTVSLAFFITMATNTSKTGGEADPPPNTSDLS